MTPRQELRRLIGKAGYTMVPGAYDTLTARLVEAAGFEAVYLTGGGYSRASGYPDLGLLSLTENAMFIVPHRRGGRHPGDRRRRHRLWQCHQRDPHRTRIREEQRRRLPHRGPGQPE